MKLVGFLGTLAALGFSTIYICGNVDCYIVDPPGKLSPNIRSVSRVEVAPGQAFNVTGENFDRVEGIRLRKEQLVERLFMMPLSDTGMLLSVPSEVAPDKYILEIRRRGWKNELVSTTHEVTIGKEVPKKGDEIIFFANLNWDSVRVQNAIARFIVEKGYNKLTDTLPELPGEAEDVWKSLLTGSVQVYMEIWLPNSKEEWEKAMESASVIPLGKSLDLSWQSGFVVPSYLIRGNLAQAPGLQTVQDIRDYADVFAKPGSNGKAVLWNCVAVSNCAKINQEQVTAYGLDDVIQVRDPGSYDALIEKLLLANESKTPWLGYMWGPTIASTSLDLTRLEEPRCEVGTLPQEGCGYDDSQVRIAVHPDLISKAPEVVELLRKWDFKESTQFVAEACLKETKKDFEKAAICYLKSEEAVWSQWVTPEAFNKVREALKQ